MKKAKLVSLILTMVMMASLLIAPSVSAEQEPAWTEDFQQGIESWTIADDSGQFQVSEAQGFASKPAADTALRIYRAGRINAGENKTVLSYSLDTPVEVPSGGVYRVSMEIAKQEFASDLNIYLIGDTALAQDTQVAVAKAYNARYALNDTQVAAPFAVGKWYRMDVEQKADGSSTVYLDGAASAGSAGAALTTIKGVRIEVIAKTAPMDQSEYVTGEYLPADILLDNFSIETAASEQELSPKTYSTYLNSLNMTFDQINYNFDHNNMFMRPYNSTNGDNHAYNYGNAQMANCVRIGALPTDGTVHTTYKTEAGLFGKAASDSALKLYVDAGTMPATVSRDFHMNIQQAGYALGDAPAAFSQSGDQVHISASFARSGLVNGYLNLFGDNNAGSDFLAGANNLVYIERNGTLTVAGNVLSGIHIEPETWYKLDFIVTVYDDKHTIETWLNGQKLFDSPLEFSYMEGKGRPSKINMRMAASVTPTSGTTYEAQGFYWDDLCCMYYPSGAKAIDPTVSFSTTLGDISGSALYLSQNNVPISQLTGELTEGGNPARVLRYGEEVADGVILENDILAVTTEFGGEILYKLVPKQQNMIQENTMERETAGTNQPLSGWDLNKVGGQYAWASTYLENEGLGAKAADDRYFVFKVENFTDKAIEESGLRADDPNLIVNDPHMNTFHTASYPVYTYELSFFAGYDSGQVIYQNIWGGTSTLVTALSYDNGRLHIPAISDKIIKEGLDAGRWYKTAITVHSDGSADYYLNGDLILEGEQLFAQPITEAIPRYKLTVGVNEGTEENPGRALAALDNIRWYGADYAEYGAEDQITITGKSLSVEESSGRILINGAAMPKAAFTNAIETDGEMTIYTDNTFSAECGAVVPEGAVVVLKSANGEVYKYFDVVNKASLPTQFGDVTIQRSGESVTATVSFSASSAQDAVLMLAAYEEGRLVNIGLDQVKGATGENTLTCTINALEQQSIKAFVWDSLDRLVPLKEVTR